jgi:hypothetical protein
MPRRINGKTLQLYLYRPELDAISAYCAQDVYLTKSLFVARALQFYIQHHPISQSTNKTRVESSAAVPNMRDEYSDDELNKGYIPLADVHRDAGVPLVDKKENLSDILRQWQEKKKSSNA